MVRVRSPVVQKDNQNNLKINIYAEPYWKRSMAKSNTVCCVLQSDWIFHGTPPPPSPLCLKRFTDRGELNDLNGKKVGPSINHSIFSGSMIFFSMVSYYETVKVFSFLSLFISRLQRVVYDRGSNFFSRYMIWLLPPTPLLRQTKKDLKRDTLKAVELF